MSDIKFTERQQAEIETLTLTKKIAHGMKGALTAKQLAEILNINRKTVSRWPRPDAFHPFALGLTYASMLGSSSTGC